METKTASLRTYFWPPSCEYLFWTIGRECARILGKGMPPWEQGAPAPQEKGDEQQLVPDSGGGGT